jgi:hypothetical protein
MRTIVGLFMIVCTMFLAGYAVSSGVETPEPGVVGETKDSVENVGEPRCGHVIWYENAYYLGEMSCAGVPADVMADPESHGYVRFDIK